VNVKNDLQQLNDKLDKTRRKLAAAKQRGDLVVAQQFSEEMTALSKQIASIKGLQSKQLSAQAENLRAMPFHRVLSKAEQADLGKFKKSVKGLVVVHPLTALGRELGVAAVTGYGPRAF
jgi:ribosome-associated protein